MEQARYEYGEEALGEWREVPDDVADPVEYAFGSPTD